MQDSCTSRITATAKLLVFSSREAPVSYAAMRPASSFTNADEVCAIRVGPRTEFLHASAEAVGAVKISFGIDRHLMQFPELAGERAVRAPRVEQRAVGVVLEHLGVRPVGDPDALIRRDQDVVRLPKARPEIEPLAV